jgi:hypothetical protein
MKRQHRQPSRFRQSRVVAILPAVAVTCLIDLRTTRSEAMTKIDDLVRKLESESDSESRYSRAKEVRRAVCQMDPSEFSDELVDKLIGLVLDNNELVRAMSASALMCIGPQAKRAIPALEAAVDMSPHRKALLDHEWMTVGPSGDATQLIIGALQELRKE